MPVTSGLLVDMMKSPAAAAAVTAEEGPDNPSISSLSPHASSIYYLPPYYYQKLGEVWDHEIKDFKIFYKPLYSCESKVNSYEAHHLAVSTFERWYRRFIPSLLCQGIMFYQIISLTIWYLWRRLMS